MPSEVRLGESLLGFFLQLCDFVIALSGIIFCLTSFYQSSNKRNRKFESNWLQYPEVLSSCFSQGIQTKLVAIALCDASLLPGGR